jgi:alanine-synthesizing transaminase
MIEASKRLANFHYAIRDIVAAAARIEQSGREVIRLNIGDPQAFGIRPPGYLIDEVAHALRERFTGYSSSAGLYEARQAVAIYATDLGAQTTPDDVLLSSGASEAAELVLTALLNPGDEVLIPAPGYPLYPAILAKLGAVARPYDLHESDNWHFSVEEITTQIGSRVKAIVLINPNNPTGSITSDETTREVLEVANALGVLVISDEVYRDMCFTTSPTTASKFAEELGTPLITLESLSKSHMLTGWRVGWMRFTNAEKFPLLRTAIAKLAGGRLCSSTPAQYAVKPALENHNGFLQEVLNELRWQRDFIVKEVESSADLACVSPDAAFYLMLRVAEPPWRSDSKFVLKLLDETGVLVVPGSGFGCEAEECFFRLVFLADYKTLSTALDKITEFIRKEKSQKTII